MNIKEAVKIVRKHLIYQVGIAYHQEPPVSIYNINPDENLLFSYNLFGPPMVGGSNYIAVSKATGEVRVLRMLGE